ncbi:hypothetical protein E2C01_014735 [Portunus trituberculatus]|uniref:Uncharacterized protein n=1 Tax=Portunus trituberculatus TaxID=210409 RepID=A0A5B7DJW5_PORTR|nr:hypothetical protein [Portunus trituberculatus]
MSGVWVGQRRSGYSGEFGEVLPYLAGAWGELGRAVGAVYGGREEGVLGLIGFEERNPIPLVGMSCSAAADGARQRPGRGMGVPSSLASTECTLRAAVVGLCAALRGPRRIRGREGPPGLTLRGPKYSMYGCVGVGVSVGVGGESVVELAGVVLTTDYCHHARCSPTTTVT